MASTFTVNGGIELIGTGEQSGTWGDTTNTNLRIIDRLTNGVGSIALSGTTHTLTTAEGALSDGQYKVLVFGGTPSGTNTVTLSPNDAQHVYFVKNDSGQSVVLSQGSGGNVTVADGKSAIVYADGAGAGAAVVDITSTTYSAGTGLSLVGTVFNNTAPDQTVGLTGSGIVSISGTYPNFVISATALEASDIGVTVQGFDANTAKYDDATANFTGTLQNGGSNVVVDSDIGVTVQGFDANTAKYDDATANFTGTLQNGGSNVLVDTDIGSTVLAFDTNLQGFVSTFTLPTADTPAGRVLTTDGAGNLTLAINPSGAGGIAFSAF
jgi:hypothetical protein